MTSLEPSNSVVHRLAAAINDGDRDAFLATLTPHATLPPCPGGPAVDGWVRRAARQCRAASACYFNLSLRPAQTRARRRPLESLA